MSKSIWQRWGALAAAIAIGFGLAIAVSFWPHKKTSHLVEGQTLLGKATELFADEQLAIQFKPPNDWSVQGRTLATPDRFISPRMVVKFKRLAPGVPVAWLRVYVHEVPADQTPVNYLKKHQPRETSWKLTKEVESDLKVGGERAARITYAGPLDPNGRRATDYTAEHYAVRRGNLLFEISGTFPTTDDKARSQFRSTIDSMTFLGR